MSKNDLTLRMSVAEIPLHLAALWTEAMAALATQPDRYAQGFERAREMALDVTNHTGVRGSKVPENTTSWAQGVEDTLGACSNAIRSMEMPDE